MDYFQPLKVNRWWPGSVRSNAGPPTPFTSPQPTAEDKRAALVVANAARMHCKTGKQLVAGIYHLALLREGDTRLAVAGVSQATVRPPWATPSCTRCIEIAVRCRRF